MLIKTSQISAKSGTGPSKVSSETKTAPNQQDATSEAAASEVQDDVQIGPLSGDSGQRVGHFVRGVTLESLQHLRYLSAATAAGNIGSALGSLTLTPLAISVANENAALIGGLGIGGTIAAGAIGAVVGFALLANHDKKSDGAESKKGSSLAGGALNLAAAGRALPSILYPTVSGATDAQIDTIYNALDKLPLEDVTSSATMQVVPDLVDTGISGMAQPGSSHVHILLDESYINNSSRAADLVIHEQGHAVDYGGGFGVVGSHNWRGGFGKGEFVTEYASTNRYEDFAESYEHFHQHGEEFSHDFPEKAGAIERVSMQDPLNRLADQPKIREAGKEASKAIGKVPYLRTGLEVAGSLIAPAMLYRGATKLSKALQDGDDSAKVEAKMNLASGLFLSLPGASPLALVSSVAGSALKAVDKADKHSDGEWSNKWADRILATSAGPLGMGLAAVKSELNANGMKFDASEGFAAAGWQQSTPSKGALLKGTVSTVGGVVIGSMLGAAVGGAVGGQTGAVLGTMWGQVAGGAIGLVGHGVYRASKSSDDGKLALTSTDKSFLRGMAGGAVLGGAGGTVAGAALGRLAGELIGNALLGPEGGAALKAIGGWTGGLAGGYGGAKLGAGVGSGRLLGRKATT